MEKFDLASELRQHESAIFNFFRRVGLQQSDAEDCTQDTFLRALRGIDTFRGDAAFKTWLLAIARNIWREQLRRRRFDRLPNDLVEREGASSVELLEVLAMLDDDDVEVLVLRHITGLRNVEVAYALGISDEAARQRISRAAARFRGLWGQR